MALQENIILSLRQTLQSYDQISGAILFGSSLTSHFNHSSDLDLALFLASGLSAEESINLRFELETIAGRPVDLVEITPELSLILQNEIVRHGMPILANDEAMMSNYLVRIPQMYEDFMRLRTPIEDSYIEHLVKGSTP